MNNKSHNPFALFRNLCHGNKACFVGYVIFLCLCKDNNIKSVIILFYPLLLLLCMMPSIRFDNQQQLHIYLNKQKRQKNRKISSDEIIRFLSYIHRGVTLKPCLTLSLSHFHNFLFFLSFILFTQHFPLSSFLLTNILLLLLFLLYNIVSANVCIVYFRDSPI